MSLPYTCSPHHDPTLQVLDAQDEAAEATSVSEDWSILNRSLISSNSNRSVSNKMGQAAMYLSVEGQRQPRVSKKWAQHPLPLQLCGELAIFFLLCSRRCQPSSNHYNAPISVLYQYCTSWPSWPIIFFLKWTIDAWNKFYTWSHPKIFIFASVISVSFAQNRPKSDISGALGPIHYITLKAFTMALEDGTKCKTCFGGPRMILHDHWKNFFPK